MKKYFFDSSTLPARIACGEALAGWWVEPRVWKITNTYLFDTLRQHEKERLTKK